MFKICISDYLNMLNPKYFMLCICKCMFVYINIYRKLPQKRGFNGDYEVIGCANYEYTMSTHVINIVFVYN